MPATISTGYSDSQDKKKILIYSYFNMTNKFYFLNNLCSKREKGQKRQNILKIH